MCRKSVDFWVNFSYHQMTALHVAASAGRLKIVDCLVDKGADIDIQNDEGVRAEFCHSPTLKGGLAHKFCL